MFFLRSSRNIGTAPEVLTGAYVPNDEDDEVLYGVIDKVTSMFD